jgi:hypothetical protein
MTTPQRLPLPMPTSLTRAGLFDFTCPHCGKLQQIPYHYDGKPAKCLKCSKSITPVSPELAPVWEAELQRRQEQEEQERIQEEQRQLHEKREKILLFLQQSHETHYVSLDADTRALLESEYRDILAEGVDSWGANEQGIHIEMAALKGRAEWMETLWRSQVLSLLAAIQAGQGPFAEALGDIANKMGAVKAAATVGGILAAQELGERLGESLSGGDES